MEQLYKNYALTSAQKQKVIGGNSLLKLSAHCSHQLQTFGWTIHNGQFITSISEEIANELTDSPYYNIKQATSHDESSLCVWLPDLATF